MLQKGFFITEPFNPSPFWDNTIVNLSGAAKFEEDTVFPAGRYSVDVQAGGGYEAYGQNQLRKSARIVQTVSVQHPFVIRAYCGSAATASAPGVNPYNGAFKVNPYMTESNVPAVSHIFGNSGSTTISGNYWPTSGNCLGDGASITSPGTGYYNGAGSCLHFVPQGGVFGNDFLAAFHVTAAPIGTAGSGSAYGGAGSGVGGKSKYGSLTFSSYSYDAGSTPHGQGGAGVPVPSAYISVPGNDGTGVGYGIGGRYDGTNNGAGAWFDGTTWHDSRSTADTTTADGHIIVKYIGTIN